MLRCCANKNILATLQRLADLTDRLQIAVAESAEAKWQDELRAGEASVSDSGLTPIGGLSRQVIDSQRLPDACVERLAFCQCCSDAFIEYTVKMHRFCLGRRTTERRTVMAYPVLLYKICELHRR
jgi:hypothetical protein